MALVGAVLITWGLVLFVVPYNTLMRDDGRPWNNAECGSLLSPHWPTYAEMRPAFVVSDEKTDFCYVAQLARADHAALAGASGVVLLIGGLLGMRRRTAARGLAKTVDGLAEPSHQMPSSSSLK